MSLVDMRIDLDGNLPEISGDHHHHHRRSNPLPLPALIDGRNSRRSSSCYSMLPEEPLKVSVLKLDGSRFDIEVAQSATVAQLRQAVEDVFSHMPSGNISWPHVWSHFCLTFEGQKLLTDTDSIGHFGIRDGSQLQFIRHISTSNGLRKKRSTKQISASEQRRICDSNPNIREEKDGDDKKGDNNGGSNENNDMAEIFKHKESRWAGFIQRLFPSPYSRLPTS